MPSFVTLAWAATGQVCDENGVRLAGEPYSPHRFPTAADARDFCRLILLKLPFLECHISGDENTILHSEHYVGQPFAIAATGRYCVRLFEWVSKALVSETGAYLSATDSDHLPHAAMISGVGFSNPKCSNMNRFTSLSSH